MLRVVKGQLRRQAAIGNISRLHHLDAYSNAGNAVAKLLLTRETGTRNSE